MERREAVELAERVRDLLHCHGVGNDHYSIPSLQDSPEPLPLPFPFFGGGFFGEMFRVESDGTLAEFPSKRPTSSSTPTPREAAEDSLPNGFFREWWTLFHNRWVRAGELTHLIPDSQHARHAAAVQLGKSLKRVSCDDRAEQGIEVRRSGNSQLFRLAVAPAVARVHGHPHEVENPRGGSLQE